VQLIDSETGFHVLSRSFDHKRDDFFDIRDEITELTVANVRVALPSETQAVSKVAQEDPVLDAYILYRRGLEAAREPTTESIAAGLELFDAALDAQSGLSIANIYEQLVGNVAQTAAGTRAVSDGFRAFKSTLEGQHLAISGVNIDEEAVNLIGLQRAFQASARVITTTNELLDTLINL
jgi:flagellar hook-associated protein FlgK